jgi:1,4-alpha-glucan branching enzyme
MKKIFLCIFCLITVSLFSQVSWQGGVNPESNQTGTILFDKSGTPLASYTGTIYAHTGVTLNGTAWQNVIGSWGSSAQPSLTLVSGTIYKLDITPTILAFYGVTSGSVTKINIVLRSASGSAQTVDLSLNVGAFQMTLASPIENSYTIVSSGYNTNIVASNTGGNATYSVTANGLPITCSTAPTSFFTCGDTNVTTNKVYVVSATIGTTTVTKKFTIIVNPGPLSAAMDSSLEDGINYNASDATKATLVLNAPFKDFVYVAGSFNNWNPTAAYAMKKDPITGKFWLELTGLTPGEIYAYQYWVCDNTSRPTNSPAIVKTADPFSALVLSPFDDPEIVSLGVYPNLPVYSTIASGQEREVTVLQTGPTAFWNYAWSPATTNFVKPKKKDLVIYEALVRDFDANRTYQDLINRIDYFKNLKINAIQLMPVMEFEGNLSWGYNTVFHMALDKRYGPPAKLKEFVDLCHQNGIAVILDLALNHVFGRSPLVRMWMLDADGDGWGDSVATSTENPYINQYATHAYGVGSDLNHFREPDNLTNTYVIRTLRTWIQDYKIDGFRWDLTKGFTNQCTTGDETCTNGYRSDRVAKMKSYADRQWELDPNSYIIFEHLGNGGSATEETEWANYLRSGDNKGIMFWRKMTDSYAELIKGNFADISGVADSSTDRFIGYAESHDEERIAYKSFNETGQTQGNLNKIEQRLSAMGAVHLLVPGPKMIWHFGELGWDSSLWTCNNGVVSYASPDCKLDTKPQPQWSGNWLADTNRSTIYNNWAKMIDLKKSQNVFENGTMSWNIGDTGHPRLDVYTSTAQTPALSYVFVLTNFSDTTYNVAGGFPFTGTWANLMDNTTFSVTNQSMNISIEPGGFRVFGNQQVLDNEIFDTTELIVMSPNPAATYFTLNTEVEKVQIFSITGQLVKIFTKLSSNDQYSIADLNQGIYLVKITDTNNREKTMRLIKE